VPPKSAPPAEEVGVPKPDSRLPPYHVAIGGNLQGTFGYLLAASQGVAAWFHNGNQAALAAEPNGQPDQHVRLSPALVTVEAVPSGDKTTRVVIVDMAKGGLIKQRGGQKAAERIAELLRSRLPGSVQ